MLDSAAIYFIDSLSMRKVRKSTTNPAEMLISFYIILFVCYKFDFFIIVQALPILLPTHIHVMLKANKQQQRKKRIFCEKEVGYTVGEEEEKDTSSKFYK